MQDIIQKFISWIMLNIALPTAPVLIKLVITIFADETRISVAVLDSVELLYYNLFICVIFLNLLGGHESKNLVEYIMNYLFILIAILDLILIFLNYANMASYRCSVASIILSIAVPSVVSIYQRHFGARPHKERINKF